MTAPDSPSPPDAVPPSPAAAGEPKPKPAPRSRIGWRTAAIMVVVVVVADVVVRLISPQLLPPETNGAGEVALKAGQLDALRAAGGADLVVMGDSMVDAGVDPVVLAAKVPGLPRAYNAALRGARLPTQRSWLGEAVLPKVHPKLVLQGVSPTLISSLGVSPTDIGVFDTMLTNNLRQLDPDPWDQLEDIANDYSYLVRYRTSLRSPTQVGRATWGRITGKEPTLLPDRGAEYWRKITAPTGQNTEYTYGVAKIDALRPLFESVEQLLDGGYHFDSLDALLSTYAAAQLPVVVVIPPVAVDLLREGGIDPARWRASAVRIAERAAKQRVPVLDFSARSYPNADFYDLFHLNGKGAAAFSSDLGTALAELCRTDASLGCG